MTSDVKLTIKGMTVKDYGGVILVNEILEHTLTVEDSSFENVRGLIFY